MAETPGEAFHTTRVGKVHSDFPLFALEHGLAEDRIREIRGLLLARLASRPGPGISHWLLWVVYATELGYDYDGEEYWHSFEERTPRWRDRGSRNQLRAWFSRFRSAYSGVRPSGSWAAHFPIIAWPITHAILSKYLQWQFAKAIYDLRYRLAGLNALSPNAVGQLLASNAWEASSRFQEFLQQQELAGRIALALVGAREVEGQSPIYPQTLQRLVSDLEEVQSAREWLKETRRFVRNRLIGTARASGTRIYPEVEDADDGVDASASLRIRPTLMLRRAGASTWSAVIDVASFAAVARIYPQLRAFLAGTRCRITGTGDTWLPSGWLLSSARRRVLKSWPGAGVPLVRFERPNEILDQFVDSETSLPAGPVWLCRVGNDGLAREIAGRIVRPGRKYILLSEAELSVNHPFLSSCGLDCAGIHAAFLSMPDTFSSEHIAGLQRLGLQVARTVRVWPAGLSGRGWDGEGHSEWLTTEAPCFGIVHDHPVDTYGVRLDDDVETSIAAPAAGAAVFVRISPLLAGTHTLSIKARRRSQTSAVPSSPAAEGVITLEVREPEPWIPGTTSHPGLAISVDPPDPSLDMFWEGDVGVSILGPAGRHITCAITLATLSGKEVLSEQISTFELPVTAQEWQKKFSQFVNTESRAWTYLEAASGRFLIKGDELGEHALRLERNVKPVRWVCRSAHHVTNARLIDDSGREGGAVCRFFSLRRPAEPVSLDTQSVLAGYQVPSPGGLFEARSGELADTMIVSLPQIERGFQGLVIEPDLQDIDGDSFPIVHVLELLRVWSEARILGPLVGIRRRRVVERILNRLYSRLCGHRWAEAEAAYLSNPQSEPELRQLERLVGGSPGFVAILRRDQTKIEVSTGPGAEWFADVAARYQVCSEKGLCEFALQLASHPHNLILVPRPVLDALLSDIKDKTILLRGARFLALLSVSASPGFAGGALPRWKW